MENHIVLFSIQSYVFSLRWSTNNLYKRVLFSVILSRTPVIDSLTICAFCTDAVSFIESTLIWNSLDKLSRRTHWHTFNQACRNSHYFQHVNGKWWDLMSELRNARQNPVFLTIMLKNYYFVYILWLFGLESTNLIISKYAKRYLLT